MKSTVIKKDGYKYKWRVEGLNEGPCIVDIENNNRTKLTDYIATMFSDRYGCIAHVQEVREMTHNQYQEFLKNNASRLYAEEGYTTEDYYRDAASVEVLDFDLSKFNLTWSDSIIAVINELFSSESVNKNGNMFLEGHAMNEDVVSSLANKLNCNLVCDNIYNGFYKNDACKCILEFCESDVSLILCETEEAYKAEIVSFNKFYEVESEEICIRIYFDDVHMDNVFVSKDKIDTTINAIARGGYENYNAAVKEDWKNKRPGSSNPKLRFEVVFQNKTNSIVKSVDDLIANAQTSVTDNRFNSKINDFNREL